MGSGQVGMLTLFGNGSLHEHEDLGFRALGQGLLSDLRRFRVRFARLQDIKGPWR